MDALPSTLPAVPLFPLPDYYLFPGVIVPLHVFETRYRQMIDDLMDGPGRLVMTALHPDAAADEHGPAVLPLGTLVEILQHERLEDGRYVILVMALTRVAFQEVDSARLYRKVDAEPMPDADPVPEAADALRISLEAALHERSTGEWDTPDQVTVGRLADLLLHSLPLEPERQAAAYVEVDAGRRAAMALAWHDLAPPAEADGANGTDSR